MPAEPARTWHFTREGRAWAVVAFLMVAAGWIKTINLLLLFGYLMFGLLGVNAWVARATARRLTAARMPVPPGFAGKPVLRQIDVTNPGTRPVEVSLTEESPAHAAAFYLPSLAGGETRRVFAEFTVKERGVYPVSPVTADAGYPFGLLRYTRPLAEGDELVVLPAVGVVDTSGMRRWLVRSGAGESYTRRPARRQSAHQADVRGVRTYRPGDAPRDVHWRTTARRGTLMVREYDSTEPLDLVLVVEPWLPTTVTQADRDRLETTLSLAASVFWAWCHTEESPVVTLALTGPGGGVRSGRAGDAFAREALKLLAPVVGSTDTGAVAAEGFRRMTGRSARVLVSSRPGTPLLGELRARTGLPFVPLDPGRPVAWYTPPAV